MKKTELDEDVTPDSDLTDLKLDRKHSEIIEEHNPMEEIILKTARLAKLNLVLTILGLGGLGYLHFSGQSATEDAIARSKATMKQEIVADMKDGLASTQQLQLVVDKNTELEGKVDGYSEQISNLEMKVEQVQGEVQKTAGLSSKIAQLQASMKKPAASKSAPAKATKTKAVKKPVKKGRK